MNTKQIAFIICINNMQYYSECVRYIQELEVPEGYSTDIISIQEADSMTQGYNAGMQASDAKYKVYLHHDTFILNKNFIADILKIFQQDETIGMMGVIGAQNLSADANCYLNWNIGRIVAYNGRCTIEGDFSQILGESYIPVKAIEGLIMVTQYDIPWREDFLDGWDFYDISQSLEMQKRGYKVVVPYQETPWCYHDCGIFTLKTYDFYRHRMILEYPEVFTDGVNEEEASQKQKEILETENIRKNLIQMMEVGAYEELRDIAGEIREIWPLDTQIREIVNMMEIYSLEKECVTGTHSEWLNFRNWEKTYEYYNWIRLVLIRIQYQREDERARELKEKVESGKISRDAICKISSITLKSTSNVYKYLLKEEREMPLVSVVVAVYNGESVIRETLESILQQTYRNIEVIVIDDASTDNSRKIIESYKDSRIKAIFLEKNHNICYAGNLGFRQATGKYVAIAGHDDVWKLDKLEKQISFLEEHPDYSVCFTWADIIDENGDLNNAKWSGLYERFCRDNLEGNQWSRKLIEEGNYFCAPTACIRREFLEKTGYYRYALVQLQDYDLWIRLLSEGPVYVLQEKLTYYRRFNEAGRNLSTISMETQNRDIHEMQWIQDSYIGKLSTEKFVQVFSQDMKNPDARSDKEILCEKAFLLWKLENCFAEKWFIELLEDEECRNIFAEKYQFELKDFYEMNTKPMYFDNALMETVRYQQCLIENYQKMQSIQKKKK